MTSQPAGDDFDPNLWRWGTNADQPRLLLTMLRVKDLDAALRFYVDGLGMKELERFDIEATRTTGQFLSFGDYASGGFLELAHHWDATESYSHGTGYGHIAIGVPDVTAVIAKLEAIGAEISVLPKVLVRGGPHVAFVKDPDGYTVELVQTRR